MYSAYHCYNATSIYDIYVYEKLFFIASLASLSVYCLVVRSVRKCNTAKLSAVGEPKQFFKDIAAVNVQITLVIYFTPASRRDYKQ